MVRRIDECGLSGQERRQLQGRRWLKAAWRIPSHHSFQANEELSFKKKNMYGPAYIPDGW